MLCLFASPLVVLYPICRQYCDPDSCRYYRSITFNILVFFFILVVWRAINRKEKENSQAIRMTGTQQQEEQAENVWVFFGAPSQVDYGPCLPTCVGRANYIIALVCGSKGPEWRASLTNRAAIGYSETCALSIKRTRNEGKTMNIETNRESYLNDIIAKV